MIALDTMERQALAGLAEIGVAKAAAALGKLMGSEVEMTVPDVAVVTRAEAASRLDAAFPDRLVAVSESFGGPLVGAALLVVPQHSCADLVRAVLPDTIDPDHIAELEDEALGEVGNIVLNNWLAVVANRLEANLNTALPVVLHGDGAAVFAACGVDGGPEAPTIVFDVRFIVREQNIPGQILVAMDASSEAALRERIARYVNNIPG